MKVWSIDERIATPGHPEVLASTPEGRAISLRLRAGQALDEHQVYERAWIVLASGRARVGADGDDAHEIGPGALVMTDPKERHRVEAIEDADFLLVLTPWPGPDRPEEDTPRR